MPLTYAPLLEVLRFAWLLAKQPEHTSAIIPGRMPGAASEAAVLLGEMLAVDWEDG